MQTFQELIIPSDFKEAEALLRRAGLDMPEGVTYGLGAYEDGTLAATGFLAGTVVCGICVNPDYQGEGLAAAIVGRLMQHALDQGQRHLLLFTKPVEAAKFSDIGFHRLAATASAALLEWGRPDYRQWLAEAGTALNNCAPFCRTKEPTEFPLGAIVMNANPFTLGHRHLVLEALGRCRRVIVFVVEEDASSFPFTARYALVRDGLADQERTVILPGGPYMVSRASFPSYFTGKAEHSRAHAELDCTLFAERIAPDLGIAARFVGEEPYCDVTASYNTIMREILPAHGVACVEIPRLAVGDAPVSASGVRAVLREADGEDAKRALKDLVPASTAEYLASVEAKPIITRLREQETEQRH